MAYCASCGKQTSWFRRTSIGKYEFCNNSCANSWEIAHPNAAALERKRESDPYRAAKQEAARKAAETRRRRRERNALTADRQREAKERADRTSRKLAEEAQKETAQRQQEEEREAREAVAAVSGALGIVTTAETSAELFGQFDNDVEVVLGVAREAAKQGKRSLSIDAYARALDLLGSDVDRLLEIAQETAQADLYDISAKSYLRAIALGIPNLRLSASTKWEYANVLIGQHGSISLPSTLPEDAEHYLSEAEGELKRHVRSGPSDLEALRLLEEITTLLGKSTTAVEEQIKRVEIRQALLGQNAVTARKTDRTGTSF